MTDVKKDVKKEEGDAAPVTKKKKFVKAPRSEMYFEIGRVCSINFGPYAGKICIILDFVDSTRALIDGPESRTGVPRQTIPFKRLSLTKIKIKIIRACRTGLVRRFFDEQEVAKKWKRQNWAKKVARDKIRRSLTDLDRFKVMVLQMKKSYLIRQHTARLRDWRKLALDYKPGTTDEPEKLLAAKRMIFGMKNYRNIKKLKYEHEYNLTRPLTKQQCHKRHNLRYLHRGFKVWIRMGKRSRKKSKARRNKAEAKTKAWKKKQKESAKKVTLAEWLAKKPKRKLNPDQKRKRLQKLFAGKSAEEIILLKRKYKQKKRWEYKKILRAAAKRKAQRIQTHNALVNKRKKAKGAKYKAEWDKKMAEDPEFKKNYLKKLEARKKRRAADKIERKKKRKADLKKRDKERKAEKIKKKIARAAREAAKTAKESQQK